jgi:hypothetical protein
MNGSANPYAGDCYQLAPLIAHESIGLTVAVQRFDAAISRWKILPRWTYSELALEKLRAAV